MPTVDTQPGYAGANVHKRTLDQARGEDRFGRVNPHGRGGEGCLAISIGQTVISVASGRSLSIRTQTTATRYYTDQQQD